MGIHMNKHNLSTSSFKNKKPLLCFLAKGVLLLVVLFLFCFEIVMPQYLYGFNASIIDKVQRAESIKEPKILLIGNSNLVFGIDSEMIEEEIGMPVVNMGVHAGLGNAFLDNMSRYFVNEGDIVIFCHTEYEDDDKILNEELAWITIENHYEPWKLIRGKDIWGMIKAYPTYLKDCIGLWIAGEGNRRTGEAYTREFFDEYGDNIFPRKEQQIEFREGQIKVPAINSICIDRMNSLNKLIQEKGGTMLVAAYPIVGCEFTPPVQEYEMFQEELEKQLHCPVISDFTDYIIDEEYFFDSAYHLNEQGVKIRTEKLINDLRIWLAE